MAVEVRSSEDHPGEIFSPCFSFGIDIGLKMNIVIEMKFCICHVKVDTAREIKVLCFLHPRNAPICLDSELAYLSG